MNREELLNYFDETVARMRKKLESKNHDYTSGNEDALANFKRCSSLGICSNLQGALVRLTNKLCRCATFSNMKELKVSDETVQDTADDGANYFIIFGAIAAEERKT